MEAGLLIVAMCIVALTTLTLANETHWARSVPRNDCFARHWHLIKKHLATPQSFGLAGHAEVLKPNGPRPRSRCF